MEISETFDLTGSLRAAAVLAHPERLVERRARERSGISRPPEARKNARSP
jgi:hypothetical protein